MADKGSTGLTGEFDEDQPSPAELKLDVLIALELGTGSPAAEVLWKKVRWAMPADVKVRQQVKRKVDGRTTDVEARGGGRRLLCEDKLADGLFRRDQVESYRKEVLLDPKHTRALVIAPKKFVEKARLPAPLAKVAVEDLAEALNAAAQGLASSTSDPGEALACSYRYRAQALLDLCKSNSPAFSDLHVAFSRAYDERAQEIAGGRVRLPETALATGGGLQGSLADPCAAR